MWSVIWQLPEIIPVISEQVELEVSKSFGIYIYKVPGLVK